MPDTVLRVLLVEDEKTDQEMVRRLLNEPSSCTFEVQAVDNLAAALQRIEGGDYHAVLLDLKLPDSSGLDTLRAVVGKKRSLPVVVLTGFDDDETAIAALRGGAQDYVAKQDLTADLLRRVLVGAVERGRLVARLTRHHAGWSLLIQSLREFDPDATLQSDHPDAFSDLVGIYSRTLAATTGTVHSAGISELTRRLVSGRVTIGDLLGVHISAVARRGADAHEGQLLLTELLAHLITRYRDELVTATASKTPRAL